VRGDRRGGGRGDGNRDKQGDGECILPIYTYALVMREMHVSVTHACA